MNGAGMYIKSALKQGLWKPKHNTGATTSSVWAKPPMMLVSHTLKPKLVSLHYLPTVRLIYTMTLQHHTHTWMLMRARIPHQRHLFTFRWWRCNVAQLFSEDIQHIGPHLKPFKPKAEKEPEIIHWAIR